MKGISKYIYFLLIFVLVAAPFPWTSNVAAASDTGVQVAKTIDPAKIFEGEEAKVTLNIQGSPDVNIIKPNDIILIIDRSGSMAPTYGPNKGEDKMKNAKDAAKGFIDLVDFSKHRVGVVDFASNISYKDLSTNPSDLKSYIDKITANGGTGTKAAIAKAQDLLKNHRPDAQPVIILMTDGEATEPAPNDYARQVALEQANNAKNEGVIFYTIALLQPNEDPEKSAPNLLMKEMATTAQHHHFVLGSVGLAEIYAAIVQEIGLSSAYNVTVTDTVAPEFEIVPDSYKDNIPQPVVSGNTLTWKFNELKKDMLTFNYKIKHKTGARVGVLSVGEKDVHVKYDDYLGQPHETDIANPTITVSYHAPEITSVVEDHGKIAGGESVVINGKYFLPDSVVLFGTTPAGSVQYVDSTKLIVTAPSGTQGSVDLKVTNKDGQFATAKYRYYADPVITSVTPNQGPLKGENTVTIEGNYFMAGATVWFGDQQAVVSSITPTKIVVKAPASATEKSVDVRVVNEDRTEAVSFKAYSYVSGPQITSLTPNQGLTTGGQEVTVAGEKFIDGAKVYFDSTEVPAVFVSPAMLKIVTPQWPKAGSVKVKVVNPDGQQTELANGYTYTYPKPEITSVDPNSGSVFGGTLMHIYGKGFLSGAKVYFDNTLLTQTTFTNSNEILVRTPAWNKGEAVDVRVVNPDGQDAVLADGFTYQLPAPPKLDSISPAEGPQAGGTVVTLTGAGFRAGLKVYFDSTLVSTSSLTDTKVTLTTPKWTTAEKVDIKVVDNYGQESILTDAFEYLAPPPPPAPKILSVTPNSGPQAGGTLVSINGSDFVSGAKVYLNDKDVTSGSTFSSKTLIYLKTPAWTKAESVSVKVVNPDNLFAVLDQAFTYDPLPAPEITTVTPNKGPVAGGTVVALQGKNFVNGATLKLGAKDVTVTFVSAAQLQFKTPAWSTGESVDIIVTNPDGQKAVLEKGYTFETPPPPPAPVISNITPDNGEMAGGTLVYINGSNFVSGAKVYFDSISVATTLNSSSQLIVRSPAWTTAESVDIRVVNPDQQEVMLKDAFTYNAPPKKPEPIIIEVKPSEGETTGGQIIDVTGQNFESGTKVYFNDTLAATTFYNSTTLKVKTPVWPKAESVNIKVVNPDNQEAILTGGFTFILPPPPPAPVVQSVSPSEVAITGGTIVTITGKNFVNGAKVKLGNTNVAVTFMSSTQLAIKTPVWAQPEAVDVTVQNPDNQIGVLNGGLKFVLGPPPVISSITPNSAVNTGGDIIAIAGSNFNSSSKVFINNVEAATTLYSSTDLRARVPASTVVGPVDVKVINVNDGQFVVATGGLTYKAPAPKPGPTITSISPNNGSKAGGYIINVYGTNFASTTKVYVNNVIAPSTFYGATQLLIRVPASSVTGPVTIKVENADGQIFEAVNGFTYN
ncbi:IPT/TIG domain-containing protein [Paenibacillus sp. VCA1]|uniref:IPT/TIG domain-containing protein n=1 Tax=Paenibacillus sp. VCA1 TaxID=3039148 RepID=UPI002871CB69|nr:IPT/TIG domain-containing protein [Paenibacillus sp. VCA1]MDR9853362.1 IPT/TIG domain-containing protein [Paenibacillus sp. VCA1]